MSDVHPNANTASGNPGHECPPAPFGLRLDGPFAACLRRARHGASAASRMAGAGGFEPPNTGSKVPRLTAWPRPNEAFSCQLSAVSISYQKLSDSNGWMLIAGAESFPRRGSTTAAQTKIVVDRRTYGQVRYRSGRRETCRRIAPSGPARRLRQGPRCSVAARADANTPNTVEPLPDIAAISAPRVRKPLLQLANRRVALDDRRLQVVDERDIRKKGSGPTSGALPKLHPPFASSNQRYASFVATPNGGMASTTQYRGRVFQRIDLVAAAQTERGAAEEKKRHVGAEPRRQPRESARRAHAASIVSASPAAPPPHRCFLPPGPPASESSSAASPRRRAARRPARRVPQQLRGLPHEIRAVGRHARHVAANLERAAPRAHVTRSNRLMACRIVWTSWNPSRRCGYAQRQVDLGERAKRDRCHRLSADLKVGFGQLSQRARLAQLARATAARRRPEFSTRRAGREADRHSPRPGSRSARGPDPDRAARPATGDRPETRGNRSRVRRNARPRSATRSRCGADRRFRRLQGRPRASRVRTHEPPWVRPRP